MSPSQGGARAAKLQSTPQKTPALLLTCQGRPGSGAPDLRCDIALIVSPTRRLERPQCRRTSELRPHLAGGEGGSHDMSHGGWKWVCWTLSTGLERCRAGAVADARSSAAGVVGNDSVIWWEEGRSHHNQLHHQHQQSDLPVLLVPSAVRPPAQQQQIKLLGCSHLGSAFVSPNTTKMSLLASRTSTAASRCGTTPPPHLLEGSPQTHRQHEIQPPHPSLLPHPCLASCLLAATGLLHAQRCCSHHTRGQAPQGGCCRSAVSRAHGGDPGSSMDSSPAQ